MFKHWQSHSTKTQIHVKTIKCQIYTQVKAVHINGEIFYHCCSVAYLPTLSVSSPVTLLCTKPGFKPVLFLIVSVSQSRRPFFMLEYNFVVFKYFNKNKYILFILYCCSIMLKLVWSRLEKKESYRGKCM